MLYKCILTAYLQIIKNFYSNIIFFKFLCLLSIRSWYYIRNRKKIICISSILALDFKILNLKAFIFLSEYFKTWPLSSTFTRDGWFIFVGLLSYWHNSNIFWLIDKNVFVFLYNKRCMFWGRLLFVN